MKRVWPWVPAPAATFSAAALVRPTSGIEWLTFALVVITGYYAQQNSLMVSEMRRTRAVFMPKIEIDLMVRSPNIAFPGIVNVGPGLALEVDVTLSHMPEGPSWRFQDAVMTSGEEHSFAVKDGSKYMLTTQLTDRYPTFTLTGSCRDVLAQEHAVHRTIRIKDIWDHKVRSEERVEIPIGERIQKELKELVAAVEALLGRARLGGSPSVPLSPTRGSTHHSTIFRTGT